MSAEIKASKWVVMALAIIILAGQVPASADTKMAELEQKVADISLLYQQLEDRSKQAYAIHQALVDQEQQLTSEVLLLTKSLNINSLNEAQEHMRLRFNIELLRTILTYRDKLEEKLTDYQTGRDRLSYLRQLVEDDIKMIATLNDLKIDALTTQISLVINQYLPEAHVIQIDPQQLPLLSAEDVWHRIK